MSPPSQGLGNATLSIIHFESPDIKGLGVITLCIVKARGPDTEGLGVTMVAGVDCCLLFLLFRAEISLASKF
jgi:hypothetical protein